MGAGLAVKPGWPGAVDGVVVSGWCGRTGDWLTVELRGS